MLKNNIRSLFWYCFNKKVITSLTITAVLLITLIPAYSYSRQAVSPDGNIKISYSIVDGYKISISIQTKASKKAFSLNVKTDVMGLDFDFLDLNRDGYMDIMIKYQDEGGFSPSILINRKNISFSSVFSQPIYVSTEAIITEQGKAIKPTEYKINYPGNGGLPDIVFYNVYYENIEYKSLTFRFNKKKGAYMLSRKGKSLGEVYSGP